MDLLGKNKFTLLIILGSLFSSPLILAQVQNPSDSVRCTIELQCHFSGLEVLLDSIKVGKTPIPILHVSPGIHRIRVRHPDPSGWLNQDWEKKVILKKGEKTILLVQFPIIYWIESDPPGASVFFMGRKLGTTPTIVKVSPKANGFILLKKTGYKDSKIKLSFPSSALIHVSLKKIEMLKEKSNPHKLKRNWVIGSGVVALFSGIAGYCFKTMANHTYGKYMTAGIPKDMNRYFNNTVKFDKISTGFYTAAEVSLVFSLFLFIKGM